MEAVALAIPHAISVFKPVTPSCLPQVAWSFNAGIGRAEEFAVDALTPKGPGDACWNEANEVALPEVL